MLCHRTTCRVIYGDTDNMGVAYYANYLRWFETGRTETFRSLGLTYKDIEAKGVFLPVSEAYCKYKSPARYDDLIVIETTLDTRVKGGIKCDYRIFREEGKILLAEGYTKHACLSSSGRVIRPPAFLLELLSARNEEA